LSDLEYVEFLQERWANTVEFIEGLRLNNITDEFFEGIKRLSSYNTYEKRDGSIVSVMADEKGELITHPDTITEELIRFIKDLQGSETGSVSNSSISLPPLTALETEQLLKRMARGKGISLRSYKR